MDDLTERIEALLRDQEEHPEKYIIVHVCDKCGDRKQGYSQANEVERFKQLHGGSNEIHYGSCPRCTREEDESED